MITICRTDVDVRLEGVPGWDPAEKSSSIHAAQEAVMHAVGEDMPYAYLVGVSGLAFRMQISRKGLCPSSAHPWCGYPCVERSCRALPWRVRVYAVGPNEREAVKAARRAVVDSLERKVPVEYGSEEDGIIIGYAKGGDEWICRHPLRERGTVPFVEAGWPCGIVIFTERKDALADRQELTLGALQQAVTMAHAPGAGDYLVGFAAWEAYIQRVASMDEAEPGSASHGQHGNAWVYACLTQFRACAAAYLRGVAPRFDAPAAGRLQHAADLYAHMAHRVLSDEERAPASIAPFCPRQDEPSGTPPPRGEQVQRLREALALEREAISELEAVLSRL